MSADHDKNFFRTFSVVLGILFAITFVSILAARLIVDAVSSDELRPAELERIQTRTDPAYRVITDPEAARQVAMNSEDAEAEGGGEPMSGDQVYQQVCAACHAAGVAGAPETASTDEWNTRLADKGLETLYDHAINGFNAMPAKGGNPALSNEEVEKSVDYILSEAGAS